MSDENGGLFRRKRGRPRKNQKENQTVVEEPAGKDERVKEPGQTPEQWFRANARPKFRNSLSMMQSFCRFVVQNRIGVYEQAYRAWIGEELEHGNPSG